MRFSLMDTQVNGRTVIENVRHLGVEFVEEVVQRRPEVHLRRLYIGRATLAAPDVAQAVDEASF